MQRPHKANRSGYKKYYVTLVANVEKQNKNDGKGKGQVLGIALLT